MTDDGLTLVKTRIMKLFQDLDETEVDEIKEWIDSNSFRKDLKNMQALKATNKTLVNIGKALKKIVPLEAELLTETIITPTVGDQTDCNKHNTCHIDGFLYDEDETHKLIKQQKLKVHYCLECHSKNIKDLMFISHSMSKIILEYMFKVYVPSDLDGKQILDIGSRLGTVLFSAYYLTNASHIIGVEINKDFCEIQEKIMNQFSVDKNRVKNINSDILNCQDIINNSDIIILNALDFFVDTEKHKEIWRFFKKSFKKGSYLVTNRSITQLLDSLEILEEMITWFTICRPCQMENEILFDIEDLADDELFLYIIN